MNELTQAVEILRRGGLVAVPTETVYGLAADASNELAVRRIFAVKGRPSSHPLIVHVHDLEEARRWVRAFPPLAEKLAVAFWPGPLTLVLPRSPLATDAVTGGQDTVAIRVPAHPLARALLHQLGGGLAAPSANRFGAVSPTTAAHVRADLGDEVELILDGGPCAVGVESTIVDLSAGAPRLLRPGGISSEALETAAGEPVPLAARAETGVRAPGMLASHYAPRAGLLLVDGSQLGSVAAAEAARGAKVALVSPSRPSGLAAEIGWFEVPEDPAGFARVLYATLREIDARGYELIVAAPPAASGLGLAVRDRLTRAAHR
jgi:L-threonylcarbamoyladenylate synthase